MRFGLSSSACFWDYRSYLNTEINVIMISGIVGPVNLIYDQLHNPIDRSRKDRHHVIPGHLIGQCS